MSTFEDLSFSVENFSGKVRLFPLPNLVLFPHVMQPLHIFEPRYRAMLEDALAGDRMIATVLLAPGWEKDYEGRPPLHATACLGRIASYCRLEDGTYNVLLLGLRRVALLCETDSRRRFREADVEIHDDYYPPQEMEQYEVLHARLREAFLHVIPFLPDAQEQLDELLDTDIPLGMLTDIVSYMLDIGLGRKQLLLAETDVFRRAELLLEYLLETSKGLENEDSGILVFPPRFSAN
jgi:uncharacterized protein